MMDPKCKAMLPKIRKQAETCEDVKGTYWVVLYERDELLEIVTPEQLDSLYERGEVADSGPN